MKRCSILILALIAVVVTASSAFSQNAFESTRQILERTDEIIAEAQHIVATANYPAASSVLSSALDLQDQAWRVFNTATSHELSVAKRLSLEARELAQNAVAGARTADRNESTLLNKLEQVQDLLDRAGDLVSENPGRQQGATVIDAVRGNLDRAWELYRSGQYRMSLKLCNQIEQTMRKVISAATENQRSATIYERRSEFVRKGIERVEGVIGDCQSDLAPALLERARTAFDLAAELYADNKPVMAMRALQNARKLANQAGRECRGGDAMAGRYDDLLAETELLNEQVITADEQGRRLLGLVYEQLELAAGYIDSDQSASATAALKAADLTLEQLKRHLNDSEL